MDLGRILRSAGIVVVLALLSFAAYRTALSRDTDVVSTTPVVYEQTPTTPMLSPRRIPLTLQAPIVDEQLIPLLTEFGQESPTASCLVIEVEGRTLEPTLNAGVGLVPASNQKLLTTFTALNILGPDFTYRTTVRAAGPVADGVLDGDLYLVGDGDPFLSTEEWWTQYEVVDARYHTRLEDLADLIVAEGITSVTGDIVGDESLFDDQRQGPWAERLINQKQSGQLSALSVDEGFVDWPAVDMGVARLRSATNNPPVHAASVLRRLLAERGVTVSGATTADSVPLGATLVAEIESPPLIDLVTHINSYSSNFGAEMVLKRIGLQEEGVGSTLAGATAMATHLRTEGIPVDGLVINDGSGLAESNRLTCDAVTALLAQAGPESDFAQSLAIGGERGSLLNRMVGTPAAGAVYAKTGTLQDSTALSGYVQSSGADDWWLIFAYISNEEFIINSTVRDLQDPFVVGLTDYARTPTLARLSPTEPVASAATEVEAAPGADDQDGDG